MKMLRSPTRSALLALSLLLLVATACTEEQRRDIEGAGVRATIQDETENALGDEGIEIDDLDCKAEIDDNGAVTGSCTGTTTGDEAIETELRGTVDVDEVTCESTLTISVEGDVIDENTDFDCLDS